MGKERQGLFDWFPPVDEDLRAEELKNLIVQLTDAAKDYPTLKKILSADVREDGISEAKLLTSNGSYSLVKVVGRRSMTLKIVRTGRKDKPKIASESIVLRARIAPSVREPFFEYRRLLVGGSERVLSNNSPSAARIAKFANEMKAMLAPGYVL